MSFGNQVSDYGSYKYVVSATQPGPYKTIQLAINQAVADGVTADIFILPGTYHENLTLAPDINLVCSPASIVIIIGTHVPPATGTITFSYITFSSAIDVLSSNAAGTALIDFYNCGFILTNGYIYNLPNWTGSLNTANSRIEGSASNSIVNNAAGAAVNIQDCEIGAGTPGMSVTGVTTIFNSRIFCPITASGNAVLDIDSGSTIDGAITISNATTLDIYNSRIASGIAPCITTTSSQLTTLENVVLDSSNVAVIAGTGQIELGEVVFNNSNAIAGTITYANTSQLACSNINIENTISLNGSTGTAGQVLTSNGTSAPIWNNSVSTFWTVSTADAVPMVNDTGYIPKNALAHLTTYTLPATAAIGTEIEISGFDANLWTIAQNAGQSINFGKTTTPGVGGSLSATTRYDQIRLVCVTANTVWNVVSNVGNITVV